MFEVTRDVLQLNSSPESFVEADRLEHDNKDLARFIEEGERLRAHLVDEIGRLEQQYNLMSEEAAIAEESERFTLKIIDADTVDHERRLQETTIQKLKDEPEFPHVYAKIGELFTALNCSWYNAEGYGNHVIEDDHERVRLISRMEKRAESSRRNLIESLVVIADYAPHQMRSQRFTKENNS
jgi:hypothetical protein